MNRHSFHNDDSHRKRSPDASLLDGHHIEWQLLRERPCNVLLEGTVAATDAVLRQLLPHIGEPIVRHQPPSTLDLPSREIRALILTDATALRGGEQQRLLAWMGEAGSRAQIITTASCRLFALVEAGVFDAALYYRLNILLLRGTFPFQIGLPRGAADSARRRDDRIAMSTSPSV